MTEPIPFTDTKVVEQIPKLITNSRNLLDLGRRFTESIENQVDLSPIKIMAMSFANKQLRHLEAIIKLDGHRDIEIIARTMIEALCMLIWANQESETRPSRWMEYTAIYDFKLISDPEFRARTDQQTIKSVIEKLQYLVNRDDYFLNSDGRDAKYNSKPLLPEHFVYNWYGKTSISKIIDESKWETDPSFSVTMKDYYSRFSEWNHSSAVGLTRSLENNDGQIQYIDYSPWVAGQGLAVGFHTTILILELTNKLFNSNFDTDIQALKQQYVDHHFNER